MSNPSSSYDTADASPVRKTFGRWCGDVNSAVIKSGRALRHMPYLRLPPPLVRRDDHSVDAVWTSVLQNSRTYTEKRKYGSIKWTDTRGSKKATASSHTTGNTFKLGSPTLGTIFGRRRRSPIKWYDLRGKNAARKLPVYTPVTGPPPIPEKNPARYQRRRSPGHIRWFDEPATRSRAHATVQRARSPLLSRSPYPVCSPIQESSASPANSVLSTEDQPDFLDLGMFTSSSAGTPAEQMSGFMQLTETNMADYEQAHDSDEEITSQTSGASSHLSASSHTSLEYLILKPELTSFKKTFEQVSGVSRHGYAYDSASPLTDSTAGSDADGLDSFMDYYYQATGDDDFYDGEEAIIEEAQVTVQHCATSPQELAFYDDEEPLIEQAQVAIPPRTSSLHHLSLAGAGLMSQVRRSPSPDIARIEIARIVRFFRPPESARLVDIPPHPVRLVLVGGRAVTRDGQRPEGLQIPWEQEERPRSRRRKAWETMKGKFSQCK